MRKKTGIGIATVLTIAVATGVFLWMRFGPAKDDKDDVVYVNTIENITKMEDISGTTNRYAGIVEAQDTWSLSLNAEKTVKDILVETGDVVKEGDTLFTYDTEQMKADLEQRELDNERLNSELATMVESITQLNKDRTNAKQEDQAAISLQIQDTELQQKQKEYEIKSKSAEIEKLNQNISQATVLSEIDGVVKSINKDGSAEGDMYGNQDNSFITIMATDDYKIKGKVNEMHVHTLQAEMPVIVHSRVDDTKTWKGVITHVDKENESANQNDMMYGGTDEMSSTTSYPFYIKLEDSSELMIGQHVYIEPDTGTVANKKDGLYLDSFYIVDADTNPYVWTANQNNKLEKRSVKLGEVLEETMQYEILDGLSKQDAITYDEYGLTEGMKTVLSTDGVQMGQSNPAELEEEIPIDEDMPIEEEMDFDAEVPMDAEMPYEEEMPIDEEMPSDVDGGAA